MLTVLAVLTVKVMKCAEADDNSPGYVVIVHYSFMRDFFTVFSYTVCLFVSAPSPIGLTTTCKLQCNSFADGLLHLSVHLRHCIIKLRIASSGRNVLKAEKYVVRISKIKRDRGIVTISIKSEHEVIGCLLLAVVAGIA